MSATAEKHAFQAEARQLLDLMIHSIYTHKEIFLRELISNASDALDKRRFLALSQPDLLPEGTELSIRLDADKDAHTLTVSDSGIGMSREEVKQNIGTIASSGTKRFLEQLKDTEKKDLTPELIGQFGVGFYSAFMVADAVTLITRKAGEDTATRWFSDGDGAYTVEDAEKAEPGTDIKLHLKPADPEDHLDDYADGYNLRRIVKKYSDFVAYPIKMQVERQEPERDAEGKPAEGGEMKTVIEDEQLNSMKAIWLRPKEDVADEEYSEFYKHIAHDWADPLHIVRAKIEGVLEYQMLLFIPAQQPWNIMMRDSFTGVHLYVKRVFIMDDCTAILPEWLRFLRGVIDSEDLSLNASRETLQQDKQIQRIRKGVVKKVLDELERLQKNDAGKYQTFWREFGAVLKEGLIQPNDNREQVLRLCRFHSTHSGSEMTTLADYLERMKEGQDKIYYMTGDSLETLRRSPHLEAFKAKGYEVLLLADPVDEIWSSSVFEHEGKPLQSAGRGAVDLGTEEERKQEDEQRAEKAAEYKPLMERLQGQLDERVSEVRLSNRLTESMACLVTPDGGLTPQLEAMMKSMGQETPPGKRILELNPEHPVVKKMHEVFEANADDERLGQYAELLYGQSVLAEGGQLPEPAAFAKRVAELMGSALV